MQLDLSDARGHPLFSHPWWHFRNQAKLLKLQNYLKSKVTAQDKIFPSPIFNFVLHRHVCTATSWNEWQIYYAPCTLVKRKLNRQPIWVVPSSLNRQGYLTKLLKKYLIKVPCVHQVLYQGIIWLNGDKMYLLLLNH